MISRYLVILLAFIAAGVRIAQGAWVEAIGLASLGLGLSFLKVAGSRALLRRLALVCFAITALAVGVLLIRLYWGG